MTSPMMLGHELSGVVIEVGAEVTRLKRGDRVCIEPGVPCLKCDYCKGGRYNLCLSAKFCGTIKTEGMLRRYYCHNADFCFKLPDNVTLEEGALVKPLSVAIHTCHRTRVRAGKSVLICGAGPIGLLHLLTCKAIGVTKICITDICEKRLAAAKNLGVNGQICVNNKDLESIIKEVDSVLGGMPDITMECSGAESGIKLSIKVTKSGGVVALVGLGASEMNLPIIEVVTKELDIQGIFRYANCYPTALEMLASGIVDLKSLITHHFRLEDTAKGFQVAQSGIDGAIKVLIQCKQP
nr:sorbitol dehydrogenase-like isoform X2 [Parasteatoda tepidariorum]